ncbi:MAG: hypothetical protein KC422_14715 [Trueperaceae bacterium]|nr:hypothetical protein [Trueperaceae bacterium]
MIDLLFWFLVSQTLSGLPDMYPGTEVRIVSMDLITIYASASVTDDELVFIGKFEPDSEVRLLILQPDANAQETVEALGNKALHARISPEGDDILLQFAELEGPLSFKKWLKDERNITLKLNPGDDE